jgi:hypothetical protein
MYSNLYDLARNNISAHIFHQNIFRSFSKKVSLIETASKCGQNKQPAKFIDQGRWGDLLERKICDEVGSSKRRSIRVNQRYLTLKGQCHEMVVEVRLRSGRLGLN